MPNTREKTQDLHHRGKLFEWIFWQFIIIIIIIIVSLFRKDNQDKKRQQ